MWTEIIIYYVICAGCLTVFMCRLFSLNDDEEE